MLFCIFHQLPSHGLLPIRSQLSKPVCMDFYGFLLSPHPRNRTAKAMEIPATMRNRSEYTPKAADTFSQESPAIRPA